MIYSIVDRLRPHSFRGLEKILGTLVPWSGEREIKVMGGLTMHVDLANGQQRQMFWGCFAREIETWVRRTLRPGDVFVDVGANVGYLSLLAAHLVGPSGTVHSVEPYEPTFTRLRQHVESNALQNIRLHQLAISDREGILRLFVPPTSEHRDFNVSCVRADGYLEVEVPTKTLDAFVKEWKLDFIRLMKVDVEGAEPQVFAGGSSCLSEGKVQFLICEINGPYLVQVGSSPRALCQQIERLGFKFARLTRSGKVTSMQTPDLSPSANFDALFAHEAAVKLALG